MCLLIECIIYIKSCFVLQDNFRLKKSVWLIIAIRDFHLLPLYKIGFCIFSLFSFYVFITMSLLIIAESWLLKFTHLLHQLVSIPTEGTGCKVCWLSNFSPSLLSNCLPCYLMILLFPLFFKPCRLVKSMFSLLCGCIDILQFYLSILSWLKT